jgi:hypothetical protein
MAFGDIHFFNSAVDFLTSSVLGSSKLCKSWTNCWPSMVEFRNFEVRGDGSLQKVSSVYFLWYLVFRVQGGALRQNFTEVNDAKNQQWAL